MNILDMLSIILIFTAFLFLFIKLTYLIEKHIEKKIKSYYDSLDSTNHIIVYKGKSDLLISIFTIPFVMLPIILYFTNIIVKISSKTFVFSYINLIEILFIIAVIYIIVEPILSGFKLINTIDVFMDKEYFIYRHFFKYKIKYSDIKHVEHRVVKTYDGSKSIYHLKLYTKHKTINVKYDNMIGINFFSDMLLKFNLL